MVVSLAVSNVSALVKPSRVPTFGGCRGTNHQHLTIMDINVESKLKSIDNMIDDLLDARVAVEKENHKPDIVCLVRDPKEGGSVSAIVMGTEDTISTLIASFLITQPEMLAEVLITLSVAASKGMLDKK